jgi:hypothetical protein
MRTEKQPKTARLIYCYSCARKGKKSFVCITSEYHACIFSLNFVFEKIPLAASGKFNVTSRVIARESVSCVVDNLPSHGMICRFTNPKHLDRYLIVCLTPPQPQQITHRSVRAYPNHNNATVQYCTTFNRADSALGSTINQQKHHSLM